MGSLWNRSNTIERYADDIRAAGAQAFFFDGGTTTPLTVFRDAGSSSTFANPVVADAHGRWPDVFVPYITGYDVRVLTADNVQLTFSQNIPNPNPGTGGSDTGGDPATSVQTGMIHAEFVNVSKIGYVRLNGRTIGNASSGASERANADTSALFQYLWNNVQDDIATVTPSRGGSASSDFAANKNIVLPDMRGSAFIGLDDMGNVAANLFGSLTNSDGTSTNWTRQGAQSGINELFLTPDQLAAHNHVGQTNTAGAHNHNVEVAGTTDTEDTAHAHSWSGASTTGPENQAHQHGINLPSTFALNVTGGGTGVSTATLSRSAVTDSENANHAHDFSLSGTTDAEDANHQHTFDAVGGTDIQGLHSHILVTSTVGGSTSINNMPLTRLVTWFIKL